MKFLKRLALFVLVLFAVAASTHAQQCPVQLAECDLDDAARA